MENTSRRTGLQLGLAAVTEANSGDFTVKLKSDRKREIDKIISDIRSQIEEDEPATKVEFVQILQDMIGDLTSQPEPIVIKLFSQDGKLLNAHRSEEWPKRIGKIPRRGRCSQRRGKHYQRTCDDLSDQSSSGGARWIYRAKKLPVDASADSGRRARRHTARDRTIAPTQFASVFRSEPRHAGPDGQHLAGERHRTHGDSRFIRKCQYSPGETEIRRENLQRLVQVTGRLEGVDLGTGIARSQKSSQRFASALHQFEWNMAGTYEEQQKSFQ